MAKTGSFPGDADRATIYWTAAGSSPSLSGSRIRRVIDLFLSIKSLPLTAILLAAVVVCGTAAAQEKPKLVDPRLYGLELDPGPLRPTKGEVATTEDGEGRAVVGRIHVRIGDGAVILLPDGQLVARKAGQFSVTDRPFVPITNDVLRERLAAEFPGFRTRQTNHYLYVYDTSDEFVFGTSRILETMLPGVKGYAELNKLEVHNPELPLVVVMFKNEADFQKHRRVPDGVVAYYHTLTNRVFMYEQSRLAQVRPDLAIQQAISTIAHEGAHQILHNIGVQQRLSAWPLWLAEGLAEFFAPTTVSQRLRWKGAGQVNDLRMFELEQYLKSRAAEEPSGQLIDETVLAGRLTSTGYASAWALTHYLAKNRRTEFTKLLQDVSQYGPFEGAIDVTPPGVVRSNLETFLKYFGDDAVAMETRLVLHLKRQPYTDPFAEMPHLVATLTATDGRHQQRQVNTFHSPALAEKWLREMLDRLPEEQRDKVQTSVRQFPNRAQAQAFAQQWRGK